jgi:ribonuclease HII
MVMILGTDEAGRGPVIGPLIVAGVMIKEEDEEKLKKINVKDSKLIPHNKLNNLAKEIKKIADDYKVIIVPPKEIDEALDSAHLNLNWLEAHKIAAIINELEPDKVIVDCPSPNIKKFTSYLRELVDNTSIEIICEHKADANHLTAAAASILAKAQREQEVAKIEKMTGESIGSGYPSNPQCKKFLKDNWDKYPGMFRKSWGPWKEQEKSKKQKTLGEFD